MEQISLRSVPLTLINAEKHKYQKQKHIGSVRLRLEGQSGSKQAETTANFWTCVLRSAAFETADITQWCSGLHNHTGWWLITAYQIARCQNVEVHVMSHHHNEQ